MLNVSPYGTGFRGPSFVTIWNEPYDMDRMIWTMIYVTILIRTRRVDETSEAQTEGEDVEIGKEQRFGVNFENEAVVTYKKSSVSGICSQSGVFIVCMLKRQWWFLFVLNSSCWWLICLKKCLFLSYCALKKKLTPRARVKVTNDHIDMIILESNIWLIY